MSDKLFSLSCVTKLNLSYLSERVERRWPPTGFIGNYDKLKFVGHLILNSLKQSITSPYFKRGNI